MRALCAVILQSIKYDAKNPGHGLCRIIFCKETTRRPRRRIDGAFGSCGFDLTLWGLEWSYDLLFPRPGSCLVQLPARNRKLVLHQK